MTELPVAAATQELFSDEEKNWAYAAHLGPLLLMIATGGSGSFLVPLVVWLAKKDDSPTVVQHAKASLNFQLTLLIATFVIVGGVIFTLGFGFLLAIPLLFGIVILQIVGGVRACMQAGRGEPASYPLSIEMIK